MLSSYRYAASTPVVERRLREAGEEELATVSAWSRLWYGWVAAAFLRGYREATADAAFLPRSDDAYAALLDVLLIQKGAYEVRYELESRPDWVGVPLTGLLGLLEGDQA
jgi:maltose alpha-D-glucosyltransferase/alpha-amylase